MGNLISISVSSPPFLRYLCLNNLEDNLEALQKEMQKLNAMSNDLLRRVSKEEVRGLEILPEVNMWISSVGKIESEANHLLDESISVIRRLSMYGCCSLISVSTYRYSEKVAIALEKVKSLRSEGLFEVVEVKGASRRMEELPQIRLTVSQEKLLEWAWNCLMDGNIGTLGIYGMGGVGKTTLIAQINNKLLVEADAFDIVIFVVVVASKEVESIQDQVGRRLGLEWGGRDTQKEKASEILRFLKNERFVLLLDDLQRKLDLDEIGVPYPSRENRCKIVFTTRRRSLDWGVVDAQVEVNCLPQEEAWDLFQKKVGVTTLASHPNIPELARLVADNCFGLPLALTIVGKTMATKRTEREWLHAIHLLISSSNQLPGMEDDILPILKFSYDTLPSGKSRSCFLYCALFPEDGDITRQDLVDYWVGEGMSSDDRQGYEIINDLVRSSLLMEDESGDTVKMHRTFREMALWIAAFDYGRQKEHFFLVKGGEGIQEMPEVNDWRMVRRLSVTSTQIEKIVDSPHCSKLTTLFVQGNNKLKWISGDFFRWMTNLAVLNMSHNRELSELPEEISSLVSLRLLNLSWTSIKRLPIGLKNLIKLIHLDLEHTSELKEIEVIASLLNLQVVRLFRSVPVDLSVMEDIQRLESLKELSLTVTQNAVLERLLSNHRLASCTRRLSIGDIAIYEGKMPLLYVLDNLRELEIGGYDDPERSIDRRNNRLGKIPHIWNISTVSLHGCNGLRDLTWLLFAPCLGDLSVSHCVEMEEVISREKAMGHTRDFIFQNLTRLSLYDLPELKSIYWTPLPFPVLEYIQIRGCPKLRRLPFNSKSAKRTHLQLDLDQECIQGVEWEDEATKHHFSILNNRNLTRQVVQRPSDAIDIIDKT